jgi:flotillin
MLFWNVPAPDEALLISGSKRSGDESQFKIVTGHGAFVLPVLRKARYLSLALREAQIEEQCVSQQGIPLKLRAVAVFKIGDDPGSIANAARRFLAEQNDMDQLCGRIFAGHLRSIVGSLTVEDIIRERDKVAQQVKEGSHSEMEKLGIIVDALQIQEIEDPTGYISNLAAPHAAAVASAARIAAAQRDQEAAEAEQHAERQKNQYVRETSIAKAKIDAEVRRAEAEAAQAGPLAEAKATQDVIAEQTALAQRNAALTEQRLESEIRRPADAEAYRQRTLAEAARDSTKLGTEAEAFKQRGLAEAARDTTNFRTEAEANRQRQISAAEADAVKLKADGDAYAARTTADADAEAINARGEALGGENQELIAANKLVDMLPALVQAAAQSIQGSRLTVLNGATGVNDVAVGLAAQGLSIYESLRHSMAEQTASIATNGDKRERKPAAAPAPAAVTGGAPDAP